MLYDEFKGKHIEELAQTHLGLTDEIDDSIFIDRRIDG